jgi:hypothetical protein
MSKILSDLRNFEEFAKNKIANSGDTLQLDDLFEEWRLLNPLDDLKRNDLLAIKSAIRDMNNGDLGLPADEVLMEARKRYGMESYL